MTPARDLDQAAVTDALNELEEDGLIDTEYTEDDELPQHTLTDEGVDAAEEIIREKADAQLELLDLHWNRHCVEADSEAEALEELFRYVAKFRDDIGVNLLRTYQDVRDSIEQDPLPDFDESTLQRFDPNDEPGASDD
jgi:DNA-binding MarR family transcriptional regulator